MLLPAEVRESLIVALDEYFEEENDDPSPQTIAALVTRFLEDFAEEAGVDEPEELIIRLEEEMEIEDSFPEHLTFEVESNEDLEITGEAVVAFVKIVCSITWDDDEDELEDELDEFGSEYDDEDDY